MPLESNSHAHSTAQMECGRELGSPGLCVEIPGLKSETWGTHHLIQEVLTQDSFVLATLRRPLRGLVDAASE